MLFNNPLRLIASGNISPAVFVKGDGSNSDKCLQAGVGDTPIGVSGTNKHQPAGTAGDDGYHAVAGKQALVYTMGQEAPLKYGGTVTAFQLLKPDANGNGIPVTSVFDVAGAVALEAGATGEQHNVYVLPPSGSAGTSTVTTVTANTTLTAQDSGKIIQVNANDKVITLPTAAAGLRYTVLVTSNAIGGSTGTTLAVQAGDKMHGAGFTAAAGKGAVDTQATAADGDLLEVLGNGIDGWTITRKLGTWARVA